jgi:hypothetical protein
VGLTMQASLRQVGNRPSRYARAICTNGRSDRVDIVMPPK